jgi:hypothetical protein
MQMLVSEFGLIRLPTMVIASIPPLMVVFVIVSGISIVVTVMSRIITGMMSMSSSVTAPT